MSDKKYTLGDQHPTSDLTLYRIVALRDFSSVKEGEVGGWVASEDNLSHEGNCWIWGDAYVYGDARVFDDARVYGKARVSGDVKVYGKAHVFGDVLVYDNAQVLGKARVNDNAQVFGNAAVSENAWVSGNARVFGSAHVFGNAHVSGKAQVFGNTQVFSCAQVFGSAHVLGNAHVSGNSRIHGGMWKRSPLYLQGTKDAITTSSFTDITIGKIRCPVEVWLEQYQQILADLGYTKQEITEYRYHIKYSAFFLKQIFPLFEST